MLSTRLIGRSIGRPFDWLIDWLLDRLIDSLIDSLLVRLIDWLLVLLIYRLIGWLIHLSTFSFSGQCPIGYAFTNGLCEDINECTESPELCLPGACINTIGSFKCRCPKGFQQTQIGCVAIRQCQLPGICGVGVVGTHCTDLVDGSFECSCPIGFSSVRGSACVAVDECADNPCAPGSCANRPGSYVCKSVYTWFIDWFIDLSMYSLLNQSIDRPSTLSILLLFWMIVRLIDCLIHTFFDRLIDWLIDWFQSFKCSKLRMSVFFRTFSGTCPPGFASENGRCNAVGCERTACQPNSRCLTNERSGPTCQCAQGFKETSDGQCVAVNECTNSGHNPCGEGGQCVQQDGGYDCQCLKGWQKVGYPPQCADIDECGLYNPCLVGTCVNTKGSYQCKTRPFTQYFFQTNSLFSIRHLSGRLSSWPGPLYRHKRVRKAQSALPTWDVSERGGLLRLWAHRSVSFARNYSTVLSYYIPDRYSPPDPWGLFQVIVPRGTRSRAVSAWMFMNAPTAIHVLRASARSPREATTAPVRTDGVNGTEIARKSTSAHRLTPADRARVGRDLAPIRATAFRATAFPMWDCWAVRFLPLSYHWIYYHSFINSIVFLLCLVHFHFLWKEFWREKRILGWGKNFGARKKILAWGKNFGVRKEFWREKRILKAFLFRWRHRRVQRLRTTAEKQRSMCRH